MRSWPSPAMPTYARDQLGDAPLLRALRSPARSVWWPPRPTGPARLYVCGITPYDATHMGHAATYVAFDLMNRAWRAAGHDVHLCPERHRRRRPAAGAGGRDRRGLALACRAGDAAVPGGHDGALRHPARALRRGRGVDPAHRRADRAAPRAKGAVYDVDDDLYFSVAKDPAFGEVSGLDRAGDARDLRASAVATRTGPVSATRSTACCGRASAKASRAGTPTSGRGDRAGTSSARRSRSTTSGGPSTCRGAARTSPSRTTRCRPAKDTWPIPDERYAKLSVHAGMVGYDGHKMSKSRGNLVLVSAAARAGRRPAGDQAGAAVPALPKRLGVDARSARCRAASTRELVDRRTTWRTGPDARP